MRVALVFLALLVATPARAQGGAFPVQLAASVVSTALAFVAPRALDAVSVQQLAVWGLGAPAALDDTLTTEVVAGAVVLRRGPDVLFTHPVPANDAAEWGALVADLLRAGIEASAPMRDAGTTGVLQAFFDEMFNHMDPYSRYVPPAPAEADRARRSGEAGVGISLRRAGAGYAVADVNADGPAAAAGIHVGDRVLAVDDQPTAGQPADVVAGWLGGLEGTDVSLTIRSRTGAARTVELERVVLPPETVFASRQGELFVIRIASFSADTAERFAHELRRLPAGRGVRGLVLDLRGNRGGLLRQAVAATEMLLDGGLIATTAGRDPQAAHVWRAQDSDMIGGLPVVVLVDGRSASAAEIMAAALGDNGRAAVVGSTTLGKGLVQTIATLPDGGELFVSWSRVLAPAGWPLQGLGILPHVCASFGPEDAWGQLRQIARGVQPMAAMLARHRAARAPVPAPEQLALRNACPAAEGTPADLAYARWLLAHPRALATALSATAPPP